MIDARTFRDALGRFATGITVVSVAAPSRPHGITVNAFLSLSLEPPLVGVAIDTKAKAHEALAQAERYGVSLLAREQQVLSDLFAGRPVEVTPRWERLDGVPVLEDALAQLACRIVDRHPVGDHTLFVGEVAGAVTRDAAPLLYHRGRYGRYLPGD
jgi:flavin reductase (DIM6/NTAB) family NADH-FMN oxidoreductase RutF